MKKLCIILVTLVALSLPCFAQADITWTDGIKGEYLERAGLPSNNATKQMLKDAAAKAIRTEVENIINQNKRDAWRRTLTSAPEYEVLPDSATVNQ